MRRIVRTGPRRALLVLALSGLSLLTGCSTDDGTPGAEPTSISIAPSHPPPREASSSPASPASSGSASTQGTGSASSPAGVDALAAVAAAEAAVADSSTVELAEDDDDGDLAWEVTLRAGQNGRSLRIGQDGAVLSNSSEQLDQNQLGEPPTVTIQRAVQIAQQRVPGGVVTDAELISENSRRVWEVSVEATGGDRELWIDAASGEVVREDGD